jgi:hypothetical protein
VALAFGLLYGRFEAWLHGRLRPLVKWTAADWLSVPGWLRRVVLGRIGRRPRVT